MYKNPSSESLDGDGPAHTVGEHGGSDAQDGGGGGGRDEIGAHPVQTAAALRAVTGRPQCRSSRHQCCHGSRMCIPRAEVITQTKVSPSIVQEEREDGEGEKHDNVRERVNECAATRHSHAL